MLLYCGYAIRFLVDLCHSFTHNPHDDVDALSLGQFHNIEHNPFIFAMKKPVCRTCAAYNINYCTSLDMRIMI